MNISGLVAKWLGCKMAKWLGSEMAWWRNGMMVEVDRRRGEIFRYNHLHAICNLHVICNHTNAIVYLLLNLVNRGLLANMKIFWSKLTKQFKVMFSSSHDNKIMIQKYATAAKRVSH